MWVGEWVCTGRGGGGYGSDVYRHTLSLPERPCIKLGSGVSHFNVSLTAKGGYGVGWGFKGVGERGVGAMASACQSTPYR